MDTFEGGRSISNEFGSNIEPDFVESRPGDVLRMRADASIANSLGWEPEHQFDLAIGKTVDYWKKIDPLKGAGLQQSMDGTPA